MITEAVIGFFFSVVTWLLSLLPTVTVPSWLDASGPIGTVMTYAGALGGWVPMPLLVTVLLAIAGIWAVALGIKFVRIIASFFTMGGGSAA